MMALFYDPSVIPSRAAYLFHCVEMGCAIALSADPRSHLPRTTSSHPGSWSLNENVTGALPTTAVSKLVVGGGWCFALNMKSDVVAEPEVEDGEHSIDCSVKVHAIMAELVEEDVLKRLVMFDLSIDMMGVAAEIVSAFVDILMLSVMHDENAVHCGTTTVIVRVEEDILTRSVMSDEQGIDYDALARVVMDVLAEEDIQIPRVTFDEQGVDCGTAKPVAVIALAEEDNSGSVVVFDDQGWGIVVPAAVVVPAVVDTLTQQVMIDVRGIDYEMVAIDVVLVLVKDILREKTNGEQGIDDDIVAPAVVDVLAEEENQKLQVMMCDELCS